MEMAEYDEIYKIYNDGKYNMYYYQEDTDSYKGMVEKELYKENYKNILKDNKTDEN
jgi:hypothetical protein